MVGNNFLSCSKFILSTNHFNLAYRRCYAPHFHDFRIIKHKSKTRQLCGIKQVHYHKRSESECIFLLFLQNSFYVLIV